MVNTTDFKGRNTLILGGLGFIGSNLAIRLVSLGAHVTLVDSMLPQYGGNLANIEPIADQCRVNFSDIRDQYSLEYLVQGIDVIYSMAGQTSHIESMIDPITDLEINCRSQLSLLESCRKYNPNVKILYASTRQLYGRPQYLPVDEKHPVMPVDVNGINKLAAEKYYTLYSHVYGMQCVSLRLTNTYGPRQHLRGNKQGFAGVFIRQAIDHETIQIFGDGQQIRDFNYIDDVVKAFLLATDTPGIYGHVYNLGAEDRCSLLEFVQILQRYCEFDYQIVPFPPDHQVIDIGDYYSDFSRFHNKTGWTPQVSLEDGLRRTIAYFQPRARDYW
ncbi:NAD-dependent epimerase/dehydratase family protein [candidate division KSB3 bacterium]|uniref:NAD-dependent epimerase/dehydratase family protein n=1 Tax=candidate division KSB3 bacterium TaxID=2044937 RepID=A0A9D5JV04_9BACT|nr:NAD-dependent epimerase/dehydratase family protein [candidate division KSB3 bacterium]MBD3324767.1 NAD-dependent epimerase/dehydratase family protein [candidate division KSB3 bacterium]